MSKLGVDDDDDDDYDDDEGEAEVEGDTKWHCKDIVFVSMLMHFVTNPRQLVVDGATRSSVVVVVVVVRDEDSYRSSTIYTFQTVKVTLVNDDMAWW